MTQTGPIRTREPWTQRRTLLIAVVLVTALATPLVFPAVAQSSPSCTEITGPSTITQEGCYFLNQDFLGVTADPFLEIQASNVTVDGRNFTVEGPGGSLATAISVNKPGETLKNISVANFTLNLWGVGVDVNDVNASMDSFDWFTLTNTPLGIWVRLSENVAIGGLDHADGSESIRIEDSTGVLVVNSFITNPLGAGIVLFNGGSHAILDNVITGGPTGVDIDTSTQNLVLDNFIDGASQQGVHIRDGTGNDIFGNLVSNSQHGVRVEGGGGNTIEQNIFDGNNHGVLIDNSDGNVVSTNQIEFVTSHGDTGVTVQDSSNTAVQDNEILSTTSSVVAPGASWRFSTPAHAGNTMTGDSIQLAGDGPGVQVEGAGGGLTVDGVSVRTDGGGPDVQVTFTDPANPLDVTVGVTSTDDISTIPWSATIFSQPGSTAGFTTTFQMTHSPPDPAGWENLNQYLTINATDQTAAVNLTIGYDEQELTARGLDEGTVALWRHDGTSWSEVQGVARDEVANTLKASLDTFSTFAPLAQAGTTGGGGSSGHGSIAGVIDYTGSTAGDLIVRVLDGPTQALSTVAAVTGPSNGTFNLSGLADGTYRVEGFLDENGNQALDAGELQCFAKDQNGNDALFDTLGNASITGVMLEVPCPFSGGGGGGGGGFGGQVTTFFGGTVNITVTQGGSPVAGANGSEPGDIFVMPAFDPNTGGSPPPCEDPDFSEQNRSLGTCWGALIDGTTGVATFSGLANGTYDVDLFMFEGGGGFFPANFTVTGATTTNIVEQSVTIELPEPGWIEGIVVDGDGNPVVDAWVEAFSPSSFAEDFTAADGTFNLSVSPGETAVRIEPPSGSALKAHETPCNPWDDVQESWEECVVVTQGITTDMGTIALGAGGAIAGRLVDTDGNPLPGQVEAFSVCEFDDSGGSDACEPSFGFNQSDPGTGDFTLNGLGTGTYVVQGFIFDNNGTEQRAMRSGINVTAGSTTQIGDLVVGGGGTIRGIVTGSGGIADVEVGVFQKSSGDSFGPGMPLGFSFTDQDGNYIVSGVPAGDVSVELFPSFDSSFKMKRVDSVTVTDGNVTWLNVTLEKGKTVRGVVTDSNGDGVSDADVGLFPLDHCPPDQPCGGFSFTNDAGEFTVGGLNDGSFGMFVGPPPGSGLSSFILDPFTGGSALNIGVNDTVVWRNVTLQTGGQIRGNVTNGGQFAWVSVHGPSGFGGGPVKGGTFTVDVPPGTYTLTVEPDFGSNLAPTDITGVTVTEGKTIWVPDITLEPGVCVSGTVQDAGGQPVPGAFVDVFELIPPGSERFPAFAFDDTDGNGDFQACGLTRGNFGLHVEPPFGSSLAGFERVQPAIKVEDQDVQLGTIQLAAGVPVQGSVTDANGDPVAFGFVGLWDPTSDTGSGGPIESDGSFTIGIPAGTYDLEVMPDPWSGGNLAGKHCQGVQVAQDGTLTLDQSCPGVSLTQNGELAIQLSTGGALTGRLLDPAGNPVSFAFVDAKTDASFGFASTSSQGTFRVPGLEASPGDQVELFFDPPPGSSAVGSTTTITWNPDSNGLHDAGDITLSEGASLTVTVLDAGGTPVVGADVDIWSTDPLPFGGATRQSDSGGNATLRGLPDGTYDIGVFPASGSGGIFPANVTIANGTDATTTIQLTAGGSLTVTVTDADTGQPLQNALVDVYNTTSHAGAGNITNASGQALFTPPVGTYTVNVDLAGYRGATHTGVVVSASGSSLAIQLTPAVVGNITGNVTNANNQTRSISGVAITAVETTDAFNNHFNLTDATGSFTLDGLPVGTYAVFATVAGEEVGCTTVDVTADSTVQAGTLDLTATCTPQVQGSVT